jgi:pantoate--beta-alanine ligase
MIPILARSTMGVTAARAALPSPVVLVPTMGALHGGHRALLRRANEISGPTGSVAVSVFVNPLQFGAGEDLDRYPRTLSRDVEICAEERVALVFAPPRSAIYPAEQAITLNPGPVGRELEGSFRPGFFDGILTVVLKLFNLVMPDVAVFGEKDAQQLFLVRRMVADLNVAVEIAAVPTVRDPDGLAISSRNGYLSGPERVTALVLSRALRAAAAAAAAGSGPAVALAAARAELDAAGPADPPLVTDYLALVDPVGFAEIGPDYAGSALLLLAATVGKTRLIDNMPVTFGTGS